MRRIVKKPQEPVQAAESFATFNPSKVRRKHEEAVNEREERLIQTANTEFRESDAELEKPVRAGTVLTGLGAALVAILDSTRLRSEFGPVIYYGVSCLIAFAALTLCGAALLVIYMLRQ